MRVGARTYPRASSRKVKVALDAMSKAMDHSATGRLCRGFLVSQTRI